MIDEEAKKKSWQLFASAMDDRDILCDSPATVGKEARVNGVSQLLDSDVAHILIIRNDWL